MAESKTTGAEQPRLRLAMDFITMYNTELWGLDDYSKVYYRDTVSPDVFWDKSLDILEHAGIEGVEITVGLSDWRNALQRYGTVDGFVSALGNRGLELCSGFYNGLLFSDPRKWDRTDWMHPERQAVILDEIADYADFIRGAGANVMVASLPTRPLWNEGGGFVDLDYAKKLADFINQMGLTTRQHGVRLALHAASGSVFWFRRDIDLFLELTDPVFIDFCPDTAQILAGGSDPVAVLRDHSQRVTMTHWKDVSGPAREQMQMNSPALHQEMYVRVGTGAVDWAGWAGALRDVDYSGWAIIELDAAKDPAGELLAAKEYMEANALPQYYR
ncbi:sugar phosphate isomerase/epimerase family protein [Leifsonia sp. NPDC058194]|uniref:sugar phosphate isomerase/epimerase family protein n=1 Tax=Leifsonia sp. NPDC058194 TaxID=3346374 RepID=UPI0036DDEA2B